MNTNPKFHHLNIHDIDRALANTHSTAVPLICHEEDCFVEGSELHALPANASDHTAPNPRTQRSS
ncbi:MAG: hypothetical protein ACNA8L_05065 [Luteolibacter sp.]